ncbi:MAG: dolichyl-phosphate beta-glucosyltransferase [Candidatus Alkanophagales archaeon]
MAEGGGEGRRNACEVSVVLPAYNEAERLEAAVDAVEKKLRELGVSFEIIIAEDGSTDGTYEIARRIASSRSSVRLLHSDRRLGRGGALKRAFRLAGGETLAYLDVDLATDLEHLGELINSVRLEGYDVATGSRLLPGSDAARTLKRKLMSVTFNFLVRRLLRSEVRDHQCGFKAFKRSSLMEILDEVKDEHWFWDTEVLVRAQRRGLRVKEFPVRWRESGSSKVETLKDAKNMLLCILRLRRELRGSG